MKTICCFLLLITMSPMAFSQFEPNYDESKVPAFKVPEVLTSFDGAKIATAEEWSRIRRPELLLFFESHVYGKVPGRLDAISFNVLEENKNALNETARRKQIEVTLKKNERSLRFNILLYLPNNSKKAPIFLGYNFYGNHTVTEDEHVIVPEAWSMNNEEFGIINNTPNEKSRGIRTHRWAIDDIIASGFGLATIYYGEIDPDKNDFSDGLHQLFYREGHEHPEANEWGSIAAWAFGLSRALDYFATDTDVDETKVIAFGHSRLGKASLWAGATDIRFAGVVSNNSGCGGAALSKRKFGETVGRINKSFPHWFADNFNRYSNNEEALPADQHQLLALIAPRPLYVASAFEDEWADPKGEFLALHYATPVYQLFEKKGIATDEMPEVNTPIQNRASYHIRTGKHDVTDYDWEQYIKWAKKYIK